MYFYKRNKSVVGFRGAIREDVQKGKSAINEGFKLSARKKMAISDMGDVS